MTSPTRLLLLADTHLPRRARDLPAGVWAAVDAGGPRACTPATGSTSRCSTSWSAAPAGSSAATATTTAPSCARACRRWPAWPWRGCRSPWSTRPVRSQGREERCDGLYPDVDVLVFGHSHIPWDTHDTRRTAAAQPGVADRPAPPAALHLDDGDGRGRGAARRAAPPPGVTAARDRRSRGSVLGAALGRRVAQPVEEADDRAQQQVARRLVGRRGVRPGGRHRLDALDS